jgi:hypothetical protein
MTVVLPTDPAPAGSVERIPVLGAEMELVDGLIQSVAVVA